MQRIVVVGARAGRRVLRREAAGRGVHRRDHPDRRRTRAALPAPAAVQGLPAGRHGAGAALPAARSYYAENGIDLMLDTTVQAIDRTDQRVIASGQAIAL
jgi:hypothetical protein